MLIVVVAVKGVTTRKDKGGYRPHPPLPPHSRPRVDTGQITEVDAYFSVPAFLDFAQVVYARAMQSGGNPGAMSPYLHPAVEGALQAHLKPLEELRDLIFGATRLVAASRKGDHLHMVVEYETNFTEVSRAAGGERGEGRQLHSRERWTFRKTAGALSPPPERLVALACPACGNPTETRVDGSCRHCDTPIGQGRILWLVREVEIISRKPVEPPRLSKGGGVEAGTSLPTIYDPALGPRLRDLQARHPELDIESFKARTRDVFMAVQRAWSAGRWEEARPYETEHLFQTHRYWMERYRRYNLRNRLEDIQVLDVTVARVTSDAFYESITVRVTASMLDWTEDAGGRVVGGDRHTNRTFSEYWTFIRASGASMEDREPADRCPSCGAPLDQVDASGTCGYCDARITSGGHQWVLSAIEQDEAYRG